ncbi:MAG: hypothetical protein WBA57_20495 [Elainellaceae cyanobacterium]
MELNSTAALTSSALPKVELRSHLVDRVRVLGFGRSPQCHSTKSIAPALKIRRSL